MTSLGVVLVTYRRPAYLALSLDAFARQMVDARHFVLVDNGRSSSAKSMLEAFGCRSGTEVTYLVPPENVGPAGGFDLGIALLSKELSGEDWILLLDDDDPLVYPSILQRLFASRERVENDGLRLGGIGMRGARFDRRSLRTRSIVHLDSLVEVDHLHGGFAPIYRLQALWDSGGFRPELFWGFEELDVGLRITNAGWRLLADTDTLFAAGESRKVGATHDAPRWGVHGWDPRRYYKTRNLVLIALEHCRRYDIDRAILLRLVAKPLANLIVHPIRAVAELRCNLLAIRHARNGILGRTLEL